MTSFATMAVSDDVDGYLAACRGTFAGRPETHRIALYASLADRERESPVHFYRLADACLDGGSIPLWRQGVRLAFARPHDSRRSVGERREARIRLGDFGGWQDLAYRENDPDFGKGNSSCPPEGYTWWDGQEDLSGKSLRITLMGGYGDAIWWLRFVEPLHAGTSARIYWDAADILEGFVAHNVRHLARVALADPQIAEGPFDRHLSATSLPTIIGTLPRFVPWSPPGTPAPLPFTQRARIGLAWASSPYTVDHLERTVPLSVLAPLFWRDDVEIYSLQVGERAHDAYYYPNVRRPDPPLQSFSDTACFMSSLDAVISVDTSVAHLAGQLGIPTLLLLRFACDRRWGLVDTTPWYPSIRLIRQRVPGDWLGVLSQVQVALDASWWTSTTPVTE